MKTKKIICVPSKIAGADIASHLRTRLIGTPADGSAVTGSKPTSVVWVDAGDEVLVHMESLTTQITGQCVLVSIDLETDQTGRTPLVVAFSLGHDDKGALIAATDEFPRGNGLLAARWGVQVQQAAWNALLQLVSDHSTQQGASPAGLTIQKGVLKLHTGAPLKIQTCAGPHERI